MLIAPGARLWAFVLIAVPLYGCPPSPPDAGASDGAVEAALADASLTETGITVVVITPPSLVVVLPPAPDAQGPAQTVQKKSVR